MELIAIYPSGSISQAWLVTAELLTCWLKTPTPLLPCRPYSVGGGGGAQKGFLTSDRFGKHCEMILKCELTCHWLALRPISCTKENWRISDVGYYTFPLERGKAQSLGKATGLFELQINSQTIPADQKCDPQERRWGIRYSIKKKALPPLGVRDLSSFPKMLFSVLNSPHARWRGWTLLTEWRYLKSTALRGLPGQEQNS